MSSLIPAIRRNHRPTPRSGGAGRWGKIGMSSGPAASGGSSTSVVILFPQQVVISAVVIGALQRGGMPASRRRTNRGRKGRLGAAFQALDEPLDVEVDLVQVPVFGDFLQQVEPDIEGVETVFAVPGLTLPVIVTLPFQFAQAVLALPLPPHLGVRVLAILGGLT